MTNISRSALRAAVALGMIAALCAPPLHAQGARDVPVVTGPIAGSTASNHPFNAAAYQLEPINLPQRGYREDEYFLSGTANVYRYRDLANQADSAVKILRSGPYTNRILVRRPINPSRFSGNVVIEILNATNNYDLPIFWSYDNKYFINRGDVWIGITGKPVAIAGLKRFNAARYAALSWANPNPNETEATCPVLYSVVGGADHATEDGLLWDVLSQTASLVRADGADSPLHGYAVRAIYAAGYSQSAIDLVAYINAVAPRAGDPPIFDGYLVGAGFGSQASLNQCSPAPGAGDPRNVLRSRNAAIVATQSQTDYRYARQAYRPDADAPHDRYRYYEAAGPAHVVVQQTTSAPDAADTHAAGGTTLVEDFATCQPGTRLSTFPGSYLLNAGFAALEAWVRNGSTPPRAPLIEATGTAPALVTKVDTYGNGVGGVRAPELDVPVATYTESTGASSLNCLLSGHVEPFSRTELAQLYPTTSRYRSQFVKAALGVVEQGFLTPEDLTRAIAKAYGRAVP